MFQHWFTNLLLRFFKTSGHVYFLPLLRHSQTYYVEWRLSIHPFGGCMKYVLLQIGKPVIIGGQVLETMVSTTRPSRCESSDIFTLVQDGADCVELSLETSCGKYPKETVSSLSTICREAEAAIPHSQIFIDRTDKVDIRRILNVWNACTIFYEFYHLWWYFLKLKVISGIYSLFNLRNR